MCEVCRFQARTIVCRTNDGRIVECCTDCGTQSGWLILDVVYSRRIV